ncbi:MAG: magnesium/cobalt transporter CorA [Gammaproteobacteria bacterium]|nr:magnesium/cobalt transporter CorA [Gammaproteobacteria bacterium]
MITTFVLRDGRLEQQQISSIDELDQQALWIDLIQPTEEELSWVKQIYSQALPTPDEVVEIEASARFYQDEDGLHIHSYFLHDYEDRARNITVAFTLNQGRLFTLHDEDLLTFRVYRMRARRQAGLADDAMTIMLNLFEIKVERLADTLERLQADLEVLSQTVFSTAEKDMGVVLTRIAASEDMNGTARLSMMDKQRTLSYLLRRGDFSAVQTQQLREILKDIESLIAHSAFLYEKVNLLMDAGMGMINIEQNKIIKIFSIAAVVFLPPTLVASIYGMNFRVMPELDWAWGYPMAIVLMVIFGVAPYVYFKRKGWL